MSLFTPASEVILRHSEEFESRRVLFAGDLQDTLPAQFEAAEVRVHTNQYHHWQQLSRTMAERCQFGLTADAELVADCDTLIYYWPKSKQEAQFQLQTCSLCCRLALNYLSSVKTAQACVAPKVSSKRLAR